MFSDLRTVYGDFELEKGLKERIINVIGQHPVFFSPYGKQYSEV